MNNKPIVLFDIDYTLFDTALFKKSLLTDFSLYKEVLDVIAALQENAVLGIFSEGETDFQKNKLKQTNITHHFLKEHVHIAKHKHDVLEDVLQNYRDDTLFLIDDKLSILQKAKQLRPSIFTIWVKRGFYVENQEPIIGFAADAEVENLHDIIPVIEKFIV